MTTTAKTLEKQRQALAALGRDRLREITDHLELEVGDRRVIANHVEALIGNGDETFAEVLGLLKRAELKAMCAELGLDTGGREKAVLVERLIGWAAADNGTGEKSARADETAEAIAREVHDAAEHGRLTRELAGVFKVRVHQDRQG